MSTLLRLDEIEVGYGDMLAVRGVSLRVETGEIVALIGSNGAGKTTTLRAIGGLLRPRRGTIELDGARIDRLTPAEVVGRGIAHVPEGRQLFPSLTVLDNLELGARTADARRRRADTLALVFDLFPRLHERLGQAAGSLSGGEQQMCAIGRALMARPRLLMLDEPSLGLAPVMVSTIFASFARINREGVTVLLVEQNVLRALRLSQRAYVLENGVVALEGPSERLLAAETVRRAYLGR
ncbi:MAG TPA: ABC transporter ATP-binding protein [Methylomirabilota bacterium]|jgi:branched-chain amino acid transport system ATP-binding protein